jgi:hypothetical protein
VTRWEQLCRLVRDVVTGPTSEQYREACTEVTRLSIALTAAHTDVHAARRELGIVTAALDLLTSDPLIVGPDTRHPSHHRERDTQ